MQHHLIDVGPNLPAQRFGPTPAEGDIFTAAIRTVETLKQPAARQPRHPCDSRRVLGPKVGQLLLHRFKHAPLDQHDAPADEPGPNKAIHDFVAWSAIALCGDQPAARDVVGRGGPRLVLVFGARPRLVVCLQVKTAHRIHNTCQRLAERDHPLDQAA
jgi:hypothetical protein